VFIVYLIVNLIKVLAFCSCIQVAVCLPMFFLTFSY